MNKNHCSLGGPRGSKTPASQPAIQRASELASQRASEPARQPASEPTRPASQQASQPHWVSEPASQPASQPASDPASQRASEPVCQRASQPGSQAALFVHTMQLTTWSHEGTNICKRCAASEASTFSAPTRCRKVVAQPCFLDRHGWRTNKEINKSDVRCSNATQNL